MALLGQNSLATGTTYRLLLIPGLVVLLEGTIRLALAVGMEPHWGALWVLAAVVAWPPVGVRNWRRRDGRAA
ncbi:hypothetical protein [Natrarchaeobaculum aegyptiacum]|uniref:Uncharacterized protein n=1 Tax=Natrarchaeobaculum aegyptiacum TaxID=745377 RepID=A0A2Z2HTI8_9EURY|nr:hypothetical protein [Natrarchaeobaculum aegyptiacum]ARS88727.1 hypothetical protein B1756_02455 [Natrarchaeobaculum aegyptiacum]